MWENDFQADLYTQMLTKKFYAPPKKDTTKSPDIQEEIRKGNNECIGKYEMSFNNCISIFEKDYWINKVKITKNIVDMFIM